MRLFSTLAAVALALVAPSAASAATVTFDGSSGTDWHNAANWDTNTVPTAADDVVIPNPLTAIVSTADAAASQITHQGINLRVNGRQLTIGGGTSSFTGPVQLDPAGVIRLNGTTNWSAGAWFVSGSVALPAVVENAGTLNITGNVQMIDGAGSDGDLRNLVGGTINRTTTTGQADLVLSFDNDGVLNVQSGTLLLGGDANDGTGGATSNGDYNVGAGAVMAFGGATHALGAGASVVGAGTVKLEGGTLSPAAGANYAPGSTLLSGGVVSLAGPGTTGSITTDPEGGGRAGGGTLTVGGASTLSAATFVTFSGGGTTVFQGTLTTPGTVRVLGSTTIRLEGTTNCSGAFWSLGESAQPDAVVENAGTLNMTGCTGIFSGGGSQGVVRNLAGAALNRTSGSDTVNVSRLENAGTVNLGSGTLFSTNYTQTGGTTALASGTTLQSTSTALLQGGTLRGTGTVDVSVANTGGTIAPGASPGVLTIDGDYTQGAGGTLQTEIAGTTPGTQFDRPRRDRRRDARRHARDRERPRLLASAERYVPDPHRVRSHRHVRDADRLDERQSRLLRAGERRRRDAHRERGAGATGTTDARSARATPAAAERAHLGRWLPQHRRHARRQAARPGTARPQAGRTARDLHWGEPADAREPGPLLRRGRRHVPHRLPDGSPDREAVEAAQAQGERARGAGPDLKRALLPPWGRRGRRDVGRAPEAEWGEEVPGRVQRLVRREGRSRAAARQDQGRQGARDRDRRQAGHGQLRGSQALPERLEDRVTARLLLVCFVTALALAVPPGALAAQGVTLADGVARIEADPASPNPVEEVESEALPFISSRSSGASFARQETTVVDVPERLTIASLFELRGADNDFAYSELEWRFTVTAPAIEWKVTGSISDSVSGPGDVTQSVELAATDGSGSFFEHSDDEGATLAGSGTLGPGTYQLQIDGECAQNSGETCRADLDMVLELGVPAPPESPNPPVIFVPGFMGSKLFCGASELWPNLPLPQLSQLELARDGRTNAGCAAAGPAAGQLVETALSSDIYASTVAFLRDLHPEGFHLYAWDWRKNPEEAVAGLDALIDQVRPPDGKVVLMAHSMGGLVVRSYVEDPARAAKVARAVTVATPYWGSPKTLFPFVYGVEAPGLSALDAVFDNDELRAFARHLQGLFFLWPSARYGPWLSIEGRANPLTQGAQLDFVEERGGNRSLLATALGAHAVRLDELRTNGVDYQTVVGSGIHTVGGIEIKSMPLSGIPGIPDLDLVSVDWVNGDGTVPLTSAVAATPAVRRHFVCGISHVPLPGRSSVTSRLRPFLLDGDPIASLPVSGVLCEPSGFALSLYALGGGLFASQAAGGDSMRWGRFTIRDFHDYGPRLTVEDVIVKSSNIGAARIAIDIGRRGAAGVPRRLGLMDLLPLEISEAARAAPLLPARWSDLTTMTVAYGHGLAVSPLHLATAYASLANGGLKVTPRSSRATRGRARRTG